MEPKLRFKEFSGDWEEKKGKKIFINISNKNHNGDLEVLSATQDQGVIPRSCLDIDIKFDTKNLKSYKKIEKGDFIISLRSFQGGLEYSEYEGLVSPAYTVFNFENKNLYNSYFFKYIFKSQNFINRLNTLTYGIRDGKAISFKDFSELNFKFPSLPEQTKIADFLSTVDEKIQNQQDKITHLENIKKGFMQKIFSRKIRFKDANGNEFPEWEEKKLGDIIEYITDYVAAGSFADIRKNVTYLDKGYAQLIRTIDLKNNFQNTEFIYVDKHAFEYLYRVNLNEDSIILPNVGNVGEVYYIEPYKLPSKYNVLAPNSILLRTKSQNNKFMYYLFSTDLFIKSLRLITGTSGQPKFNKTELKNLKFMIPCLKEQQKIANFLSSFDEKIDVEKETLEHLKELKKGLLQQMFV